MGTRNQNTRAMRRAIRQAERAVRRRDERHAWPPRYRSGERDRLVEWLCYVAGVSTLVTLALLLVEAIR